MVVIRSKRVASKELLEYSKSLVSSFFDYSEKLRVENPVAFKSISCSADKIREVFRHSSCLALNLQSVVAYPELETACKLYASSMESGIKDLLNASEGVKQGVLQAGVHYIMFSTKYGRRDSDEYRL